MLRISNRYNAERAFRILQEQYPDEVHNVGGDCNNPKCDYEFTEGDERDMSLGGGWFVCPQCGHSYNYLDSSYDSPGGYTNAGLTMDELGMIGENVVASLGYVEGVGEILDSHAFKDFPIDFTIGPYGVEVKTNHSESQARFKLGGSGERQKKIQYVNNNNLKAGLIGVRLNFYTDQADVYFREGFTDTWIGNPKMTHVATVDFSQWNPFKHPEDVPPASELPDDDSDIDAAFGPKQGWHSPGMDDADDVANSPHVDTELMDSETNFWGFRWGYNEITEEVRIVDDTWMGDSHSEMWMEWAENSNIAGFSEDDCEFGYGVLDLTTGALNIISYSWDYSGVQREPLPDLSSTIAYKLQQKGYEVDYEAITNTAESF